MVLMPVEVKNIYIGNNKVKAAYVGDTKVRPATPPELCFTANTANSTVQLNRSGAPTVVNIEISTDGTTWTDYTIGNTITLANIGDKVYMRNKSETQTSFGTSSSNYYNFVMGGSIAASGDVNYLLCKESTLTLAPSAKYVFYNLFANCSSLTTAPELPATILQEQCYRQMFNGCTGLVTAPSLPATTLNTRCYYMMFQSCSNLEQIPEIHGLMNVDQCCRYMFQYCSKIKISATQTGEYQTPYVITGTGTQIQYMFYGTGGTYTDAGTVAGTYYTSNTIV